MGIESVSNSFQHLNTIQNNILKNTKELSSGKKSLESGVSEIIQASRVDSHSRGLAQALRDVNQARGVLEFAESGAEEIQDSLAKVKELTIQYRNASDQDKALIKEQIDSELEGIDQLAKSKDADGNQLLSGAKTVNIQVGDEATDQISTTGGDLSLDGLDLEGFDPGSAEALNDLNDASRKVQLTSANFGAASNRLDSIENSVSSQVEASEAARSRLEDIDYAQALSEKTKNQILQHQAVAVIAQANANAGALLNLLR